jgi:hypothetical protein
MARYSLRLCVTINSIDEFLPGSVEKYLDRNMLKRLLRLVEKDRVCPLRVVVPSGNALPLNICNMKRGEKRRSSRRRRER